ncbi:MAG: NAD(P)-dependent alcohol dehydrogenase [Acidimicrobiales bacterium]
MRALQMTGWQQTGEFREVPEPDPAPGQVVIKVAGAGACHSDLHLMHDFPADLLPWKVPFTLGHENAGWVHALGAGVDGLEIGEAVAVYGPWGCGRCVRCRRGIENYCEAQATINAAGGGLGRDGGMAPFMLVPSARHLLPLGDLDPVQAAPLTDAGLTPYHAIKRSLPLLVPGSSAVVIGAGGLGHMAIQLLESMTPTTVIAVDQRESALALARELGAEHAVLADEDAAAHIAQATHGRGADVVIDLVGSTETLRLAVAASRSLGHLSIVGIGGGQLDVGFFTVPYELSIATTYWGTIGELMELLELAKAGRVHSRVQRFALDDALSAYEAMRAGTLQGRAVIVP